MPTLVEVEGFEHQTKAVNATATMDPALWGVSSDASSLLSFVTGRDGSGKALRVALNGATQARVQRTLTTAGLLYVASFYIRLVSGSTGANARAFLISADQIAIIGINTSGAIIATWGGGTGPTTVTGPSLTDNLWHRVDVRVNTSPATHTIEWSVDGSAQTNATTGGVASSNITTFTCGSNQTTATCTFELDDLILSATTGDHPLGAHTVFAVLPENDNAASVYGTNAMAQGTGTDLSSSNKGWQYLDEWPAASGGTANAADTVTQEGGTTSNFVDLDMANAPAYATSTLWGVVGIVAHQSDSTLANNGTTRVVDSAATTLTDIYSGDMSETAGHHTRKIIAAPGGGWSVSNFNGCRIRVGLSSDTSPNPEWLAVMLEAATPDNFSVAGTASPAAVAGIGAVPAATGKGNGTSAGPIIVTTLISGKDSSDTTTYGTGSFQARASALIVVCIAWNKASGAGDPTVSSVAGLTYQKVTSDVTTEIFGAGIWVARTSSGAPPAAENIGFVFGSTATGFSWAVAQFEFADLSGADALASIAQSRAGNTSAGITSDSFDFSSAQNFSYDSIAVWNLNVSDAGVLSLGKNAVDLYNDTRAAPVATVVVTWKEAALDGFDWAWSSAGRAVRAIAEIESAKVPTAGIGLIPAPTVFAAGTGTASPATVVGIGLIPAPSAKGNGLNAPAAVVGIGLVPAPTAIGGGTPSKTRRLMLRGTGGPR